MQKLVMMHIRIGDQLLEFLQFSKNERGYRLLEFAKKNELKIVNTFGPHKKSRIQTWHSPGGIYHNQIDYILVSKCFSTSVNINTRSFPGADIGSDHDMLMMNFSLNLKNHRKNKFTRNKFDLEKLKNPETKKLFEKKINEKLTEQKLTEIENTEEILQKLNITMTEIATEILGKHREKKKWITNELMDMCDLRRELKKTKFEPVSTYKQINNTLKKEMD